MVAARTCARSPLSMCRSSKRYATNRVGMAAEPLPGSSALAWIWAASLAAFSPALSTENREMDCSFPLSKSWKSSLVRVPIAWPFRSRTTTGTTTRFTRVLKVVFVSGEEATSAVFLAVFLVEAVEAAPAPGWFEDCAEDWVEDCVEDRFEDCAGEPACPQQAAAI